MDKTKVITLEKPVYKADSINQMVQDGVTHREIFCTELNLKRAEWGEAFQRGLKSAGCVTVWAEEYEGETVAILDGVRYAIYRTYAPGTDEIELYLEQRAGV